MPFDQRKFNGTVLRALDAFAQILQKTGYGYSENIKDSPHDSHKISVLLDTFRKEVQDTEELAKDLIS